MTISFGRRRLIVALVAGPPRRRCVDLPMAHEATDAELARLNGLNAAGEDRRRWESSAILYGGLRPR